MDNGYGRMLVIGNDKIPGKMLSNWKVGLPDQTVCFVNRKVRLLDQAMCLVNRKVRLPNQAMCLVNQNFMDFMGLI